MREVKEEMNTQKIKYREDIVELRAEMNDHKQQLKEKENELSKSHAELYKAKE